MRKKLTLRGARKRIQDLEMDLIGAQDALEFHRSTISAREKEIVELKAKVDDLEFNLKQARGNFEAFRVDVEGYSDLAILALLPLAAIFGSGGLQIIMVTLARVTPGGTDLNLEGRAARTNVYFNRIAPLVGRLSGRLNGDRPHAWQMLNHLISRTRKELEEISLTT